MDNRLAVEDLGVRSQKRLQEAPYVGHICILTASLPGSGVMMSYSSANDYTGATWEEGTGQSSGIFLTTAIFF